MKKTTQLIAPIALLALSGVANAGVFHNYENLGEGFLGETYSQDGLTYRNVNDVAGFYADGVPFADDELGRELIIENAALFYDDFPTYGSAINSLTFGDTYVNGNNLSIGVLASAWIDIDQLSESASLDIAFYENGPWGGIDFRLDALLGGSVVASDSYTLSDLGGRDNAAFGNLSVSGAQFDTLHLYALKDGAYSAPRAMIDNLTVGYAPVPEPATLGMIAAGLAGLVAKRKKKHNS